MIIHFKNNPLRKICENHKEAIKKLGSTRANLLQTRLAELQVASCVADLTAGQPHPLLGDRRGQMAIRLGQKSRLVFTSYKQTSFVDETDWTKVDEIQIVEIVDYHD